VPSGHVSYNTYCYLHTVSRGLGSVQRHVLDYLGGYPNQWVGLREIAVDRWGDVPPTRAQMESMKRATYGLWDGDDLVLHDFDSEVLEKGLDKRNVSLPRPFYANRRHMAAKLSG
jgi:hypothetical protein